jgi:hypothetical protein
MPHMIGSWTTWTVGQQSNDILVIPSHNNPNLYRLVFHCLGPEWGFLSLEWQPAVGMLPQAGHHFWLPFLGAPFPITVFTDKVSRVLLPNPSFHDLFRVSRNGQLLGNGYMMTWSNRTTIAPSLAPVPAPPLLVQPFEYRQHRRVTPAQHLDDLPNPSMLGPFRRITSGAQVQNWRQSFE